MSENDSHASNATAVAVERRTVLRGVAAGGAVVVGAAALAACGSDDSGASSTSSSTPSTPPSDTSPKPSETGGSTTDALVATADVPEGGGVVLDDEEVVITQPAAGDFVGFSAICTHQGCTVGDVDGGTINCPCHGSQFSIEDGSVVTGPATAPLPAVDVKVEGDSVVRA